MQPNCVLEQPREAKPARSAGLAPFETTLVAGTGLDSDQIEIWRELQSSDPELANPCFSPEFTQAAARVSPGVEVALIRQGREVVGIFPFQRREKSRGSPVGGIVSDYQGLICRPGFSYPAHELLKACGLVEWAFDRLLASQELFTPYHKLCEPSARIDLRNGYSRYLEHRRSVGTHQIRRCEYMMRRMEREIGPLKFLCHSWDTEALGQVLDWKSAQYRRSGWSDLFATEWGRCLVERIHSTQSSEFGGMLSLLYAGSRLVAGHMGMRSKTVWHYWFPAYNRTFAKYSPGLILLLKMAQSAESLGLEWIDLGTGMTLYKRRLMNASVSVAEGVIQQSSCLGFLRRARRGLKSLVKTAVGRFPKMSAGELS